MRTCNALVLISVFLLSVTLPLMGCKSYQVAKPKFGEGGGATGEGDAAPAGDEGDTGGEGDTGSEGDTGGESGGSGGGTSEGSVTSAAGSVDSLTIWNGSKTFGKASGEGYKIDAKLKKITPISKALIGSQSSGKTLDIAEEQISELMVIVLAVKEGAAPKAPETCDKDKLLGEMYISIIRMGAEELINNAGTATCSAKRYIDNASFEKIMKFLVTTFPPGTTTTTPAPAPAP